MAARKALCSMATGPLHEAMLAVTGETFRFYADRHHYELVLRTESLDPSRPDAWSKIRLISDLLRTYEIVLWLDADAIVVDPSRDIARELESDRFLYLVQHHYEGQEVPNTGVLLVRSGREAFAFLEAVWNSTEFIEHMWWENAAVIDALGYDLEPCRPARLSPFLSGVKFLGNEWNSIPADSATRPRFKHYAGVWPEERLPFLQADLAEFRARRRWPWRWLSALRRAGPGRRRKRRGRRR